MATNMETSEIYENMENPRKRVKGTVARFQDLFLKTYTNNYKLLKRFAIFVVLVFYLVYFGFAVHHSVEQAEGLIILTAIAAVLISYAIIRDQYGADIYKDLLRPVFRWMGIQWLWAKWIILPCLLLAVILYIVLDVIQEYNQLQSLSGLVFFIGFLYITSTHPAQIKWRPVLWSLVLQFVLASLVLRWTPGYKAVKWMSNSMVDFINYSMDGSGMVFGDPLQMFHSFTMVGLSSLIFVGAVAGMLYYLGVTQVIAGVLGYLSERTMGTTAIETSGAFSNMFFNYYDVMVVFREYLDKLTKSELHCFLVANHSTFAVYVLSMFVLLGGPHEHLLTATVISSLAAITVAKLNYPETEESKTKTQKQIHAQKSDDMSLITSTVSFAELAGYIAVMITVNNIVFISALEYIRTVITYLGSRVGHENLDYGEIGSYLFYPVAILLGVEADDCQEVGKLLGTKIFSSQLQAFQELGASRRAQRLSERSAAIATYAITGFSGIINMVVAVGVWVIACPRQIREVNRQMLRVLVNANIACFITACIAGILFTPDLPERDSGVSSFLASALGVYYGQSH